MATENKSGILNKKRNGLALNYPDKVGYEKKWYLIENDLLKNILSLAECNLKLFWIFDSFEDPDMSLKNLTECFNIDIALHNQYNLPRNDDTRSNIAIFCC